MKIPISVIILSAVVLGVLLPFGGSFSSLLLPLLFVLMYFSVLEIEIKAKKLFRKEIITWGLINIVFLPLFAYILGYFLNQDIMLGIVIAALAPTATSTPLFVSLVNGDNELGISISTIANLSCIVYIPLMLFILFGMRVSIPYDQVMINIFGLIFIPLFLAMLSKRYLSSKFDTVAKHSKDIVPWILFAILWIIFSSSIKSMQASFEEVMVVIPITGLLVASAFLAGYFSSKDKKIKRTMAIATGFKNISLVIGIFYNANPLTLIPPVIYIVFHHIFNGIAVWLYEKKKI